MKRFSIFVIVAIASLSAGCQVETNSSVRSGTIDDAYVENPMTTSAKKYERALVVSNQVLDRLAAHDYERIYQENLDPMAQAKVDQATFIHTLQKLENDVGPIVKYKKMQWAFDHGSIKGMRVITSIKVVEHERGWRKYRFVFRDDGKYARFVELFHAPYKS